MVFNATIVAVSLIGGGNRSVSGTSNWIEDFVW